jgi:hypothetical protein
MQIVAPKLEPVAVDAGGDEGVSEEERKKKTEELVRDLCAIIEKACREAQFLEKYSIS